MQFIIVADDDLAETARQFAHALSLHEDHSGTYWTRKHYVDNESSLAKQPVIFLGPTDVAKTFAAVLPLRFSDFGASCWFEGPKAVLIVEAPGTVTVDDVARFGRVVEGRAEEIRHIAETSAGDELAPGTDLVPAPRPSGDPGVVPPGVSIAIALQPMLGVGSGVVRFVRAAITARSRRRSYSRLQYRYLLARFLTGEFEGFVTGIDGR